MLPVGGGAIAGFWAADQGMRLVPEFAELVIAWAVVALLLIALGAALRGRLYTDLPAGRAWRTTAIVVLLGVGIAGTARVLMWKADQAPLARLDPNAFEEAFAIDVARYRDDRAGLDRLVERLEGTTLPPVLGPDEEAALLDTWIALHDYTVDLDRLRAYWEGYYAYDPSRAERSYHVRAYLLTYAAELALYDAAGRVATRLLAHDNAKTFLDAPHAERGLPEATLSRFRGDLLGARDEARVLAGEQYLTALALGAGARDEARRLGVDALWSDIERSLEAISKRGQLKRVTAGARADSQILKRGLRRTWFPVQSEAAEWMGDARVRRIGKYLVPSEQQVELAAKLEPGDVMVGRKNWYLSNVGLPGFWPHAMLWVGEPAALEAWADDAEVKAWVLRESGDSSLSAHLARRAPRAWARFLSGDGDETVPVIEAISEGISLSPLSHVTGDYVAALRPRLSKLEKARAIAAAFLHYGKPYDFDFDFATDHALVCTELVWRSYQAPTGFTGLRWPLVALAGRSTLPANDMIRQWATSVGTSDQQLDFVAFIDAREKEARTFFADETALKGTWERPKWDVLQK